MSGVLIATSSAADGVYVISQGEERKAIGTIRAPRALVDTMCAAPDLLEAGAELQAARKAHKLAPSAENLSRVRIASDAFDAAIARARGEQDGGGS